MLGIGAVFKNTFPGPARKDPFSGVRGQAQRSVRCFDEGGSQNQFQEH